MCRFYASEGIGAVGRYCESLRKDQPDPFVWNQEHFDGMNAVAQHLPKHDRKKVVARGGLFFGDAFLQHAGKDTSIFQQAALVVAEVLEDEDCKVLCAVYDSVSNICSLKNTNGIQVVRMVFKMRRHLHPLYRKLELTERCWALVRDMNDNSTASPFQDLAVHSLQEGIRMHDAFLEAMKYGITSAAARAWMNDVELYELSIGVCENHSFLDLVRKSAKTEDAQAVVLQRLPAASEAQLAMKRRHKDGYAVSLNASGSNKPTKINPT